MFKFDGLGSFKGRYGRFLPAIIDDFESGVELISELRKILNDIFINLTTGTWPSAFWLLFADTIWRGGHDHYFEVFVSLICSRFYE